MALLDTPKSKSIAAILVTVLLGYMIYTGDGLSTFGLSGLRASRDRATMLQDSLAMLTASTDSVKRDLARGSVEELKQKTEAYRGTLDNLRQLVPASGEVPGLIDAITTRAKIRGVTVAALQPQPVEPGPAPFDTHRYRVAVIGRYDQVGEFLTDIANLRRIIVPLDVQLVAANAGTARALGDTSKAMLEARFVMKTFVKSPGGEGGARGN
ncbi:MAG TPA: type 4a pilus biogenesis protein PilO [Gemmatimonadales bacterium]|nr:type 4a pilus biogenesis protein PilO [Gemmatimonadales bacterium]